MKTEKNKLRSNLIVVMFSQGMTVLAGILVGFMIPSALGVDGYGVYRIYTLYYSYTALLHFGLADGVLLRFAGMDYGDLDRGRMRSLSRFYLFFQGALAVLFALSSFAFGDADLRFILVMLGVNLFVTNCTTYYQFISQATQRFGEFASRGVFLALGKILICLGFWYSCRTSGNYVPYRVYVICLTVLDLSVFLRCVYVYRDITFGESPRFFPETEELKDLFGRGILLTVAYQAGNLVLLLDRQFVSLCFDNRTFSYYSFAYSIIGLFTTVVCAFSTVLLPALKRIEPSEASERYDGYSGGLVLVTGAVLAGYYPICFVIEKLLPAYVYAVPYLRVIMPALLPITQITVLAFTYYKVLDENRMYFFLGLITLAAGTLGNLIAVKYFASAEAVSWASVFTAVLWYLLVNGYLKKKYSVRYRKEFTYSLAVIVSFFLPSFLVREQFLSMIVYIVLYAVLSLVFYWNEIKNMLRDLKGRI